MPEPTTLKEQYAAQVAADITRNEEERERLSAEIAALQDQLGALQKDHDVLVSMQRTLTGGSPIPSKSRPTGTAKGRVAKVPQAKAPQAKTPATKGKRAKAAVPKARSAKNPGRARSNGSGSDGPRATLGELVTAHLTERVEPQSVAEITNALAESHAERKVHATVVRNTLESLVAQGKAERSKQKRSVFYTLVREPAVRQHQPEGEQSGEEKPTEQPAAAH
ncbi:hypothetical protein LRS74_32430 [Streptomyces sp. LX-29]|uniref:hypothetical protein n=1 Tax=Streptomyces sp. LX-29 TaxID=2900152 RepID=UPI00240D42E7|nr:hypothetical protein [Streptomyces sp. LX-29]WFB11219.1 hypothetical protein LRS74_32430 [Streptomyces sp. LX-29]